MNHGVWVLNSYGKSFQVFGIDYEEKKNDSGNWLFELNGKDVSGNWENIICYVVPAEHDRYMLAHRNIIQLARDIAFMVMNGAKMIVVDDDDSNVLLHHVYELTSPYSSN